MATTSGVWGIDLGQCALKAMRLEMIDDKLTATAFDYVEHPKILSQPDADPDQLTREALEKFLSRNSLKGDTVVISVPGQSGLARFVKLPPVEEKKIGDIVKFEAKQQIPFNLDEVVWDYQKIGSGTVTDGFALDTEIGLFAIKRDMVNRYLNHFKEVNVEVHVVQMAPLALCNFVAYDLLQKATDANTEETRPHGKKQCVVALDIGTDNSNLVITDGDRIIWQRPIPLGGNHFTRALTKDLKLTFAKAEHLKRNATKSVDKTIDLKKILGALKPVLNDFVGEVQRSLGYFTNTHRDAQVEYMVGLGNAFRLPGLQKFLSEKLGLEVRKLMKMEQLNGDVLTQPAFTDNVLSFAVTYGLALQGMKLSRIQTNLLPHEIRVDRMIRGKKPWAVAGAAALLLATAGCAISYAVEYRAYTTQAVIDAIAAGKKASEDAGRMKSTYDGQVRKAEEEEKAVKSVIAGQEERLNWLALNRFISECLPRPDPAPPQRGDETNKANLSPRFWGDFCDPLKRENANVKNAFERFKTWRNLAATQASLPIAERDDTWMKDLVLVNIEAVDCRYTDNLATFWDGLKVTPRFKDDVQFTIRPRPQNAQDPNAEVAAPEGAGWVVELRGFTFHRDKKNFVINSLVDNIADIGRGARKPAFTFGPPVKLAPVAAAGGTASAETPPAPQPATGANGEPTAPAVPEHPVFQRVSHVLVLKAETDPNGSFIVASALDTLMASTAPAAGTGTGSPEGGPSPGAGIGPVGSGFGGGFGGAGAGWPGLGGSPAGGGGFGAMGGGAGMFAPGGAGRLMGSGGGSAGAGTPEGGGGFGGGSGVVDPNKKTTAPRTEFIVLFLWKEPTPSDKLMMDAPEVASPVGSGGEGEGFGPK